MPRDLKNPPIWCKNAIPTTQGWVDPDTNELLVSLKGMENAVDQGDAAKGTTQKVAVTVPVVIPDEVPELTEDELEANRLEVLAAEAIVALDAEEAADEVVVAGIIDTAIDTAVKVEEATEDAANFKAPADEAPKKKAPVRSEESKAKAAAKRKEKNAAKKAAKLT